MLRRRVLFVLLGPFRVGQVPRAFVLAFAGMIAAGVDAAEVTTTLDGPPTGSVRALLHARRVDGLAEPLSQEIAVPGTTLLQLPNGLWEIRVIGDALWSSPAFARNTDAPLVRVWRAAALRGKSSVTSLRARFTPVDRAGEAGETDCEVEGDAWTCWIPAGRHDIRFSAPGSAPEFRFGTAVPAEVTDPEMRLNFVAGASLSGKVEAVRGLKIPLDAVEVFLAPATGAGSLVRQVTRADRRGFFQFKGVVPGDYSVSAKHDELTAQSQAVKIVADRAALLNHPVLVDRPKRLTVTIIPAFDPDGAPWEVRVLAIDARAKTANVISQSRASMLGHWTYGGLIAGRYDLEIARRGGGLWKSQAVNVEAGDLAVDVALPIASIIGRVTLGDRPLRATLSFGGEGGPKLESDDNGAVAGTIPVEGGDEPLVLVEAQTPQVRRTVKTKIVRTDNGELRFLLHLPATTLMGRVVNEDRSPAPNAILTVTRNDPDVFEQAFAGADGSFHIAGFTPGRYRVTADAAEQMSRPVSVDLMEDDTTEVELVLERQDVLRGRFLTSEDVPVIGADIYAIPRGTWAPTGLRSRTDETGAFYIPLPGGTTTFDGVAVHPVFDIAIARLTLRKNHQARIRAQQIGGTIIVLAESADGLLLLHNGGEISLGWIAGLAGGKSERERTAVPRLEPGQYSVCRPEKKACVSGYLPPHGTLTLKPE